MSEQAIVNMLMELCGIIMNVRPYTRPALLLIRDRPLSLGCALQQLKMQQTLKQSQHIQVKVQRLRLPAL